ncbi:MAG: TonB-dependent receptor [Crocinitomicaceae bacterium]|nr:TonB-dependent receptor [Crocinitomicaceae bacterium]
MKLLLTLFILTPLLIFGQGTTVKGRVFNKLNNKSIEFAKVKVLSISKGAIADIEGAFEIKDLVPGVYSFRASAAGFNDFYINEVTITKTRIETLEFPLEEIVIEQEEVVVKASPFLQRKESPVSLKTLNATEIERLPGANRDVSKVIAALPGVASRATFRNDIIIRGGSPGENKFYLDGIEVPNINHFATQGSSGGPVGLLNVNFIREVDFYSGAFPSNRANGLSSVLAFKQKEGNKESLIANFALGSSDAALTLDGPIGEKATFIFSARRSYLQFLFAALQLPILPTYNDFQYKVNLKVNDKNKVSFIGLGAIDDFNLNSSVNENITDPDAIESNNFILNNLPLQKQWNYAVGMNWLHYSKNSYQNFVVSRNMLNNSSIRYKDNIEIAENLLLDYSSFEAENKFRFEHTFNKNGWRINAGLGYEYAKYFNRTYNNITVQGFPIVIDYESTLGLNKFALFSQVSKAYFKEKLSSSFGIRTDFSSYSSSLSNPIDQLSPSFSLSYRLSESWSVSANLSRYHQLPSYTILGFRDADGALANRDNDVKYIRADHAVIGAEYRTGWKSRFTLEGFYKNYSRYPFSLNDSISLANVGSDFGVVGNEEVASVSNGRSYGLEFLYQQKLIKGFYAILAYTLVSSEFKDKNDNYVPTAWDSKHIVSLTGGKRFKSGWEVGFRWLFSGGSPYTPYDIATSSLKENWDINGIGIRDYSLLNTSREGNFHQLNVRVDKKWFFDKFSLNFYLDLQNAYAFKAKLAPTLIVETDADGNYVQDPNDPLSYQTKFIETASGILQPTLGIVVEFRAKK